MTPRAHTATPAPRHFMPSLGMALPGAGLPQDRAARLAARRAFVMLKLLFTEAVSDLPGREGAWLRHQVRMTEEPGGLWLLRGPVLDALAGPAEEFSRRRALLRRGLETLFPGADSGTGFGPF